MPNGSIEEIDIEESLDYKRSYVSFGVLSGILVLFFALLVLFTLLGKQSWKNGLKNEVTSVLKENNIEDIKVGDWIKLRSVLTVSSAVFEAFDGNGQKMFIVIIRVPTLYGPVPAVYLYSESRLEFIGFAGGSGNIEDSIRENSVNSQIKYWKDRIPKILSVVTPEVENKNE